ncbi:UDP-N-acetylglucosamine 2-epimerase (non-hydrolyzing) [Pseudomonas sp. BCRC 81390]|uniref:non-hydrolyzing UDP-N-acetylglucosamine 2-epimerase n=1 Tax=Pseudomonas sp. BCRC 81390 TaxID=3054778 RepID=UPI0025960815|nr:UDP-N-acetylglucosamine 2-epimerase (non-hydrolyzing) [Pseudomonas sp. BCRC 81390]MDM3888180.1 UDP-N-acetylglucosamine 2-epimerase (non-hydrolyzing) [Pseudomonas sp. BCRC 81390]
MKVFTVVGARPQFIKAAVLSRALANADFPVQEILVHTGQHYDSNMSDVFFEELSIPKPMYSLGLGGGTHGQNTGRMIEQLEALMLKEKPDWVLVYGDTDSTLAGAIAAAKLHIPIAHVEAGLRSYNRAMPEEINRLLTDHVSTVLFAPTDVAKRNLLKEGIAEDKIHIVGDVMCDATEFYKSKAVKPVWFDELDVKAGEYVLCTIHRAENTDSETRLKAILEGIEASGEKIVLPLHPRTKNKIKMLGVELAGNIFIVEPVGYLEMNWLESNCKLIATDSGGVQKEAYFHNKHCVTLRDETEWVELVEQNVNTLVGASPDKISCALRSDRAVVFAEGLYGNGDAAGNIIKTLKGRA